MEGTRASFDKLKVNKAISSVRAEMHYPSAIQSERFFDNIRGTGCGGEGEGNDHRDSRVATHKVFEARRCTPQAFANTIHINAQCEEREGRTNSGGVSNRMHFPCS